MKPWKFSGNSLLSTYYKIAACVGQEGTVVFLNEFITFNTLQNYYMCRKKSKLLVFNLRNLSKKLEKLYIVSEIQVKPVLNCFSFLYIDVVIYSAVTCNH